MPRFSATLDKNAKGITFISCLVMILPFITIGRYFGATHYWLVLLAPLTILLAFIACLLWRPTGYTLEPDELLVHRPIGNIKLPLTDIEDIDSINIKDQGFGLRTFGSGGFFGYFGRFWYKKLGHISMYATSKEKLLLIETKNEVPSKKYLIISPDDTAIFLGAFKKLKRKKNY